MVLKRFIKFIATKAEAGSEEHEHELQNAADQFPEITDDVIAAYIEVSSPIAADDWPLVSESLDQSSNDIPVLASDGEADGGQHWCAYHARMEPKANFARHNTARDGLQSWCRDAFREYRVKQLAAKRANSPGPEQMQLDTEEQKWCTAHQRWEPLSNFNRSRDKEGGYRTTCREYDREYQAIYRARKRLEKRYGKSI